MLHHTRPPAGEPAATSMSPGPLGQGSAELYRLLVESAQDYAIFALDATGHVLTWNRGAARFKGYDAEEIIGRHFSVFYPEEDIAAGKPAGELVAAARDGRLEDEGWRLRKDRTRFWANVVITALRDARGELVGFAKVTRDLTERRAAEEQRVADARRLAAERAAHEEAERRSAELERLNEQLQEQAAELEAQTEEARALADELEDANEQLAEVAAEAEESRELALAAGRFASGVLASIADPFVVHDAAWCFRFINGRAAELFAAERGDDLLGRHVWDVFPELVGSPLHAAMLRAATERVPVSEEVFVPARGTWSELHCYPLLDGGVATSWRDVSARKRAEEAREILAEAGVALASSLDYEATLAAVARLVVPRLADWCAVDMIAEGGALRRLAVAHADPAKVRLAWELWERYPVDPDEPHGLAQVLRGGVSALIPEISDELLALGARDAEHLRLARALGLASAMIVPLTIGGERVVGALSLVSAESGRRYTEGDLALAEELARRAGMAIASAELHRAALRAREEAERAAREAAAANRAKADFLTVMSHELRTPLNAIAGHAELIELGIHGPVTAAQLEALGRIRNSQRHLLSLINDVLNFAKLEAGHVQVATAPFAVEGLLQELEGLVAPQLRAKRLEYVRADGDPGLAARADREKVGQVLLNLLSNAIKFTPAGGRVEVWASAAGERVAIHVRDTGVGIPEDKLSAAFEPFVQVTRELSSSHEGTGLGLSISRDLARLMGGELTAVSAPGAGSTFTLALPRAAGEA